MDETIVVDTESIKYENSKEVLKQITEYLLTGEIGYISSYKECRSRIQKLSRRDIIEYMLKDFVKWEYLEWIMVVLL